MMKLLDIYLFNGWTKREKVEFAVSAVATILAILLTFFLATILGLLCC